ncbi:MAG: glycosyltransferase, partial [Actinomycetota bacterium]
RRRRQPGPRGVGPCSRSRLYLFLHDDVVLHPACVSRLVSAAVATEAGAVGGKGLAWDHPDVLVEVGMTADQFCYPFSGLEEGEIDQGQYDTRREVLFVTSACCLLSRPLIERCGSWDGGYFVFGEDLDLCIRARITGFKIVVEPTARFRHATALSLGARELRSGRPIRFYTRRNRLRTIAKTAATYRMLVIIGLYLILNMAEMVALAATRRFEEIPAYPKAIGSFLLSVPDIVRRRRAVQKRRSVPDRRIRRFMVRDVHRIRVFAERLLRGWELGTVRFGAETVSRLSPARARRMVSEWIARPTTVAGMVLAVILMVSMRGVLFGDLLASGGVWPFPTESRGLMAEFAGGWRDVGVGTPAPAPAALPIFWLTSLVSFGGPRLAQSILIGALVLMGLVGVYRFVARRTSQRWARLAAMAAYALGPATRLVVGSADLGALALFAGAPFLLEVAFRMLGPTPGEAGDRSAVPVTTDQMAQNAVRLALGAAFVIALGPSALPAIVWMVVVVGLISMMIAWDRRESIRRFGWVVGAIVAALALLLPWTLDALKTHGAALSPIFSREGGIFASLWDGVGFRQMLLLDPENGALAGLVVGAVAVGALLVSPASRRRESRILISMWLAFAAVGGLAGRDWLPLPAASPAIWMMIPLAAFAGLTGHLAAGAREELPRHVLGWRHFAVVFVSAALVAGLALVWVPRLGAWGRPESSLAAATGDLGRSVSSFFVSNAQAVGEFRVLWLGERWVDPVRQGASRMDRTPSLVTGPEGLTILDLYGPAPREGERRLEETVEALVARRLDHAGHLLATAGVRYVAVGLEEQDLLEAMQRQIDFVLEPQQGGIAIFRNVNWVSRMSLAPAGLAAVAGADEDEQALMLATWAGGRPVTPRGETAFRINLPRTYHSLVLFGDNYDSGWRAEVGDRRLRHTEAFGWSNRFEVPLEASGFLEVTYGRRRLRIALVILEAGAIGLAIAMARLRRVEVRGWPG